MKLNAFLVKYAEIGIKGKNRHIFEDALVSQIRNAISPIADFSIHKEPGRIFLEANADYDYDEVVEALQRVFGIVGICPVYIEPDFSWDHLVNSTIKYVEEQYENHNFTFKVSARRSNKGYEKDSMEIGRDMGEALLNHFPELSVDVHKPEVDLKIEIRSKAYIYSKTIKGAGGLPVGTNGKAMLLLSGGIDSPVAGYMIAKRGVKIDATYFHAPPYTSERAKQKVIDLAKLVARYSGKINLNVVNFTDIQLAIYEKCPHEELTIIMRRYMMKIAEILAQKSNCQALVTGESIGQVASQTIYSLGVTNEVCNLPVFRPCIGMDKQEIVDISEQIDTYETSIQPFEDCCTIFVAKHPVTKPSLKAILRSEEKLKDVIDGLMEEAINSVETIVIR